MKLFRLLFVMIVVLGITSVTMSNRSLDYSFEMKSLALDIAKIETEITVLRATIAQEGSLQQLIPKIEALGFEAPSKIIAVGALDPTVASR